MQKMQVVHFLHAKITDILWQRHAKDV